MDDDTQDAELVDSKPNAAAMALFTGGDRTGVTVSAMAKAEIDSQIATAKADPRSMKHFLNMAMSMATVSEDVAASCLYALPRGGKPIEGASVRLAEILACAWGNIRISAETVEETDRFIVAKGSVIDLERNVGFSVTVKRRITDRNGRKFNDDMVAVTANAANSIAYREAIFKAIPRSLWWHIYLEARKAAVGNIQTLSAKRVVALDVMKKMGVSEAQIFRMLDVKVIDEIDLDKLATLRGVFTSIKNGEVSIENAFKLEAPAASAQTEKAAAALAGAANQVAADARLAAAEEHKEKPTEEAKKPKK